MAKRKTKAQKIKKKPQYSLTSQGLSGKAAAVEPDKKEAPVEAAVSSLYRYDPLYLKKDLLKTVLVSLVILSIQISIYFWLR